MRKSSKKKVAKGLRRFGFGLMTLILIGMTTAAICGIAFAVYINKYINPELDVNLDAIRLNLTSFVYYVDKNTGEEKQLETLYGNENRVWADIDEIPKMLQDAFISVEDARFKKHNGVDWKRTLGAAANFVFKFRDNFGGGSTITQQLIKNVTGENETSVKRKIQEVMRALDLEKKYEKADILEMYLNTIFFGQQAYGVKSAAQTYFGKELSELSIAECAAIAGIGKNPYKYDLFRFPEYNKERRIVVLGQMLENNVITQEEFDTAKAEELIVQKEKNEVGSKASQSYYVDAVIEQVISDLMEQKGYSKSMAKQLLYSGGLKIVTNIDVDVQKAMDDVFTDTENFPVVLGKDGTMPQAAMVIMDPYNGKVAALYGGRGVKEGDRIFSRATQAKRAPGSSIKPLTVYAPGIEYGVITPYSVMDDVPKDFKLRANGWPKNEGKMGYSGRTTIMKAVERSMNPIPVEILQKVTPKKAFSFAKTNLGMTSLVEKRVKTDKKGNQTVKSDIDYSPMALGGLTDGVTVMEMTAAYSTFVNDGKYTQPLLYSKVYDQNGLVILENEPVQTVSMSSRTATYMIELLKNVVTGSQGTGRNAALKGMQVGGKTGTTDESYDRWFAGITPYYTGVVWFGFDKPQEIRVSGGNPSLGLWKRVMETVHKDLEPKNFDTKTPLQSVAICLDSGMLAGTMCSQDVRGSRVTNGKFAAEDVPKGKCSMHIAVEVDGKTGGIATEWCPVGDIKSVGMVSFVRQFPKGGIVVADQGYFAPYVADSGMFLPVSGGGASSAKICTVHSFENDGNIPITPIVPPVEVPPEPVTPIDPPVDPPPAEEIPNEPAVPAA